MSNSWQKKDDALVTGDLTKWNSRPLDKSNWNTVCKGRRLIFVKDILKTFAVQMGLINNFIHAAVICFIIDT